MEKSELQTRLIYIDTNIFEGNNFQFETHELEKFKKFLDNDQAYLLVSPITIQEMKRHIRDKAAAAAKEIKNLQRSAMILRNVKDISWHRIFDSYTANDITERIFSQLDVYFSGKNVESIPISKANSSNIFDLYFSESPPFANSGKKHEFPDAFILDAINTVSIERGHKVYVVSNDADQKIYCEKYPNLISISTLPGMLELLIQSDKELEEPAKFADLIFNKMIGSIEEKFKEFVRNFDDSDLQSDPEMAELEFEIIDWNLESFTIKNHRLIGVSTDHAEFEISAHSEIDVEYEVNDYDNSPWDSIDHEYAFIATYQETRRYSMSFKINLCLDYMDSIKENALIETMDIKDFPDLQEAEMTIIAHEAQSPFDDDSDNYK